jgi:hypothetical protein
MGISQGKTRLEWNSADEGEGERAAGTNYLDLAVQKGASGTEYVAYVFVYLGSIR